MLPLVNFYNILLLIFLTRKKKKIDLEILCVKESKTSLRFNLDVIVGY